MKPGVIGFTSVILVIEEWEKISDTAAFQAFIPIDDGQRLHLVAAALRATWPAHGINPNRSRICTAASVQTRQPAKAPIAHRPMPHQFIGLASATVLRRAYGPRSAPAHASAPSWPQSQREAAAAVEKQKFDKGERVDAADDHPEYREKAL